MTLPDEFWWGTAASSTQTEGAAPRSDWARWEQLGRVPASGDGNGFAVHYAEDFTQLAEAGLSHHRLSLEWARLEPEEGRHDPEAVEHYRSMLSAARDAGLSVWVCLHHFTLPGWFSDDMGGFLDDRARTYHWPRHVDWVAETFGDLVVGWKPINEPHAFAAGGWLAGIHPPGKQSSADFDEALEATHLANHEAWRLLRSGDQPVSTIHNLSPIFVADGTDLDRVDLIDNRMWGCWMGALRDGTLQVGRRAPIELDDLAGSFDLIGFSYYSAMQVGPPGTPTAYPPDQATSAMGYVPWPEGIRHVLDRLTDELPGRDLLVCENGIGTDDDDERIRFLEDSLDLVAGAVRDGAPVRGWFHWTAVDNYEWSHGHDVKFGLIERDRTAKESLAYLTRRVL